jgi:caa(3)-type oxidase subunit IV
MSQPIVPQKTYLLVFLGLVGLTILTTGVAFIDLGPFNTVAALAIAFTKMLLVILFFMGVRRLGADYTGRRFFLARSSDRLHDGRLSHPLLDARA